MQLACLDRAAASLDRLTESLSHADAHTLELAVGMTNAIPPVDDCRLARFADPSLPATRFRSSSLIA